MQQTWSITQMKVPDLDVWMRAKLMRLVGSGEQWEVYMHTEAREKLTERCAELKPETLKLMIGLQLQRPLKYVINALTPDLMTMLCQTIIGVQVIGEVRDGYDKWYHNRGNDTEDNTIGRTPAGKVLTQLVHTLVPMVQKAFFEETNYIDNFMATYYYCTITAFKYAAHDEGSARAALEHRNCPPHTMIECLKAFPKLADKESPKRLAKYIKEGRIVLQLGGKHVHTVVAEAHEQDKVEPVPEQKPAEDCSNG